MEVRRAGRRDLTTLIELHRAFCLADAHPFNEDRARAAFTPLLDDDAHGVVWMIDRPQAYAVLTWGWSIEAGGAEAVLDEIFATERGAGAGSVLLRHVLRDAEQRGLARVFLETEVANGRVRNFYRRHGFTADDSVWMSIDFVDLS
jgi:GNAT superfamily N-acetyltransferase